MNSSFQWVMSCVTIMKHNLKCLWHRLYRGCPRMYAVSGWESRKDLKLCGKCVWCVCLTVAEYFLPGRPIYHTLNCSLLHTNVASRVFFLFLPLPTFRLPALLLHDNTVALLQCVIMSTGKNRNKKTTKNCIKLCHKVQGCLWLYKVASFSVLLQMLTHQWKNRTSWVGPKSSLKRA